LLLSSTTALLAAETVNHAEEPILLLAHPDVTKFERRLMPLYRVRFTPALVFIEDSEQLSNIIWGADNTFKNTCRKG